MKISIIGAGRVGTNLAQILALRNFKNEDCACGINKITKQCAYGNKFFGLMPRFFQLNI